MVPVVKRSKELSVIVDPNTGVLRRNFLCDLKRTIAAAVIDDHVVPIRVGLLQNAVNALAKVLLPVIYRRDYTD